MFSTASTITQPIINKEYKRHQLHDNQKLSTQLPTCFSTELSITAPAARLRRKKSPHAVDYCVCARRRAWGCRHFIPEDTPTTYDLLRASHPPPAKNSFRPSTKKNRTALPQHEAAARKKSRRLRRDFFSYPTLPYSGFLRSRQSSSNCARSTNDGASSITSRPALFFGKAM